MEAPDAPLKDVLNEVKIAVSFVFGIILGTFILSLESFGMAFKLSYEKKNDGSFILASSLSFYRPSEM